MEWFGIIIKGLFYATLTAIIAPVLVFFRIDERGPGVDDGMDLGCEDDDEH